MLNHRDHRAQSLKIDAVLKMTDNKLTTHKPMNG